MTFSINPAKFLQGEIFLPASKSYSIRAFLIAACGGRSRIIFPSNCDDANVAIRAAQNLGARIRQTSRNQWSVEAGKAKRSRSIQVGESGTVLRFLLPLLSLSSEGAVVSGEGTLKGRPNAPLTALLRRQGVDIRGVGKGESIPIRITGGPMRGGRMEIPGNLSSQFISALLIACPQIEEHTRLLIRGKKLVSGDYIEMTLKVLARSGVRIFRKSPREFLISGGQAFKGLKKFVVPSDFGLAAFLLGAACLVPSRVVLRGFLPNDLVQADGRIFDILKKMGARFSKAKKYIRITGPFALKGGDFSLESAPDLVPVLSVLALFANGPTRIYNIRHARAKESDRLSDLRRELLKVGAHIDEGPNELIIYPQPFYRADQILNPHQDHRLAMAFAVLGAKVGVKIKDMECVAKSYPDFCKDFRKINR